MYLCVKVMYLCVKVMYLCVKVMYLCVKVMYLCVKGIDFYSLLQFLSWILELFRRYGIFVFLYFLLYSNTRFNCFCFEMMWGNASIDWYYTLIFDYDEWAVVSLWLQLETILIWRSYPKHRHMDCMPISDLTATSEELKRNPVPVFTREEEFQEIFLNIHFSCKCNFILYACYM